LESFTDRVRSAVHPAARDDRDWQLLLPLGATAQTSPVRVRPRAAVDRAARRAIAQSGGVDPIGAGDLLEHAGAFC
jgi:hypothetical protein